MNNNFTIYGSAIAINGAAIIITGPSGSGKSDLAFRLIDRGAHLIADDLVLICGEADKPIICQSASHIDAIELRGVGIIPMQCINNLPLKLVVQISDTYERMPAPLPLISLGPYNVPSLKIAPFETSTPIKIEQSLIHLKSLTNMTNQH